MRFPRICDGEDEEAGRYMYYLEEKEMSFLLTYRTKWSSPVCRVEPPGMHPARRFLYRKLDRSGRDWCEKILLLGCCSLAISMGDVAL
jgi:hypothetical protein